MNLYEQHPYWLMKNGMISSYPSLQSDIKADVVVVGAGISGALTAWKLLDSGLSIVIVDKRHPGLGSTAASTSFLQYEIDTPLMELANRRGLQEAVRSYELSREAIYTIQDICKKLKPTFDFNLRPSMQIASYKNHVERLRNEYMFRRKHGFDVDWIDANDIRRVYGIEAPAGLHSQDAAEVDAYKLTHALLGAIRSKGHHIFDNTQIDAFEHHKRGVTLIASNGSRISAKRMVVACGYESLKYIRKSIAQIHTTYALVSEPVSKEHIWHRRCLIWETAKPYLYFRIANERILVGGADDMHHHPHITPSHIRSKSTQLVHKFNGRMPHVPLLPDFSWAGAFAVTSDGLPYIGTVPYWPHTYFALGFGGNGITFSAIAADIIKDALTGKKNKDERIFAFDR